MRPRVQLPSGRTLTAACADLCPAQLLHTHLHSCSTGLTGDIYLNKTPLRQFRIYSLEMKTMFIFR